MNAEVIVTAFKGIGVVIATTILMLMLENHLPKEVAEVPVIGQYQSRYFLN